ncbi:MAG: hypothetical protein ACOC2D_05965 [Spirochaetota bacterium]
MVQFYLLSVLSLILAGALAASGFLTERIASFAALSDLAERRSVATTVGVLALAIGILKFFVRAPGDGVAVVGDLLPAVAGIVTGGVLLLAQQHRPGERDPEFPRSRTQMLVEYRDPIGLAGLLVGLLHFLFPATVIL